MKRRWKICKVCLRIKFKFVFSCGLFKFVNFGLNFNGFLLNFLGFVLNFSLICGFLKSAGSSLREKSLLWGLAGLFGCFKALTQAKTKFQIHSTRLPTSEPWFAVANLFARVKAFRFILHFVFALGISCRHFQGLRLEYPPPKPLRNGGGFKSYAQKKA